MNRWLTCTKIDTVNLFKTNYGWFIIINFGEANILMKLWHKIKQAKVILSGRCIYSSLTFVFHLMTISISLCNQCLLINIVSVNPAQTLCDKVCQWLATGRWFSQGTGSSSNKTDHHTTEILLKVALNTITLTPISLHWNLIYLHVCSWKR